MGKFSKINSIKAREIIDSRGNPTVEVELTTDCGKFLASVPSGASKGKYEAVELRDGGKRYQGRGVLKAVRNINEIIGPKLKGKDSTKQKEIDNFLIKLDGTKNKSKLGANAILAVSIAVCRAGAAANHISLYNHINQLSGDRVSADLPRPCFNVLEGGVHAKNKLDIQEFMVVPQKKTFSESFKIGKEIYKNLKKILEKKFGKKGIRLGDEGGFVPPISQVTEALDLITKAITTFRRSSKSGDIGFGLDCAASHFGKNKKRKYNINFYQNLIKKYPIIFLEDPFGQDDWQSWQLLNLKIKNLKLKIFSVGDDLLATNPKRMKIAKEKRLCTGAIIKPNQIGTVSETLEAARLAKSFGSEGKPAASYGAGWKIVVSHRSGETNDDFISDLAVGISADFIKAGAPGPKERLAKYKRLLQIEKELK